MGSGIPLSSRLGGWGASKASSVGFGEPGRKRFSQDLNAKNEFSDMLFQ